MKHILLDESVCDAMAASQMEGHTVPPLDLIYCLVNQEETVATFEEIKESMDRLAQCGILERDENGYALKVNADREWHLAQKVAKIMTQEEKLAQLPLTKQTLSAPSANQIKAISNAGKFPISLILGGSGTGKTTTALATAISYRDNHSVVLTAVTDAGASALASYEIQEVKSLEQVVLAGTLSDAQLIIVDEAELLTSQQADALFATMSDTCRVVLVGNPIAPFCLGGGNVLNDLKSAGIPCTTLPLPYRPAEIGCALHNNLRGFDQVKTMDNLMFDHSFQWKEPTSASPQQMAVDQVEPEFYDKKDTIVLCENREHQNRINETLQTALRNDNPVSDSYFRHGDPIITLQNDSDRGIFAGTRGIIHGHDKGVPVAIVHFHDDCFLAYDNDKFPAEDYDLAYCVSLDQVRGQDFDHVHVVLEENNPFQTKAWLQSVLYLARKSVTIYGTKETLHGILKRAQLPPVTNLELFIRRELQRIDGCRQYEAYLMDQEKNGPPHCDDLI